MTPRVRLRPSLVRPSTQSIASNSHLLTRPYAAVAPASLLDRGIIPSIPIQRHHPLQPPSHRRPDDRKSQLLRQYVATIRSCPIILVYQHSSIVAKELAAIRRELKGALSKVDKTMDTDYADLIKLQVIRNGIFDAALKLADNWHPTKTADSSPAIVGTAGEAQEHEPLHILSGTAYKAVRNTRHGLEPLLAGPLAVVTLPFASPEHLKTIFSILSPNPQFPAPKRKAAPSYYERDVQTALPKLMLLGARVEGKAFDIDQARWVGSIQGGLGGLRAQLVAALQGIGAGLASTLDSAGRNLYFTLEGRKGMLEEEAKPKDSAEPTEPTS